LLEGPEIPGRVRRAWRRATHSPVSVGGGGEGLDDEELDEGDAGLLVLDGLGIVVSVFYVGVADMLVVVILVLEVVPGEESGSAGWRGAKKKRTVPRLGPSPAKTPCRHRC
jgi:hypothetical protein